MNLLPVQPTTTTTTHSNGDNSSNQNEILAVPPIRTNSSNSQSGTTTSTTTAAAVTVVVDPSSVVVLYKMIVAYDGTRFHGFQRQIDNHTLQDLYYGVNAQTTWQFDHDDNVHQNHHHSKNKGTGEDSMEADNNNDKNDGTTTTTTNVLGSGTNTKGFTGTTSSGGRRPTKRPHYVQDHLNPILTSGTKKGCCISIQECIEMAILQVFNGTNHKSINNKNSTNNKKKNNQKKTKILQQQQEGKKHNNKNQNDDSNDTATNDSSTATTTTVPCHLSSSVCSPILSTAAVEVEVATTEVPSEKSCTTKNVLDDVDTAKDANHVMDPIVVYPVTVDSMCLRFAGRTDKGVHANGQVITVSLPRLLQKNVQQQTQQYNDDDDNESYYDCQYLRKAINSRLPIDVSIQHVEPVVYQNNRYTTTLSLPLPSLFDPRIHAKLKQYSYTIKYHRIIQEDTACTSPPDHYPNNNLIVSGPDLNRHGLQDGCCLWNCPWSIQDTLLPTICEQLQGTKDYSNFIHKHERYTNHSTNNNVHSKNQKNPHTENNIMTIQHISFKVLKEDVYGAIPIPMSSPSSSSFVDDEKTIILSSSSSTPPSSPSQKYVTCTGQFVLEAKGFRRTMVRNIVGFCIDYCRRRGEKDPIIWLQDDPKRINTTSTTATPQFSSSSSLSPELLQRLFTPNEKVASCINAAPSCGLCLEWVWY